MVPTYIINMQTGEVEDSMRFEAGAYLQSTIIRVSMVKAEASLHRLALA